MTSQTAQGLREENNKLKTEIQRLNKLTGLKGSNATVPPAEKAFDEMSLKEQESYLDRQSRGLSIH